MIKLQELKTLTPKLLMLKKKNTWKKNKLIEKHKISAFLNWSSRRGETESAVSAGTEQSHLM